METNNTIDVLWERLTADYHIRREDLLKELRNLDGWYGELNVLLSVES